MGYFSEASMKTGRNSTTEKSEPCCACCPPHCSSTLLPEPGPTRTGALRETFLPSAFLVCPIVKQKIVTIKLERCVSLLHRHTPLRVSDNQATDAAAAHCLAPRTVRSVGSPPMAYGQPSHRPPHISP